MNTYSIFRYIYGHLIIMNLYILWSDSLVPQTSYVLNSPSFFRFCAYSPKQIITLLLHQGNASMCEHKERHTHTPTHWTYKCHAPASSPRSARYGYYYDEKVMWCKKVVYDVKGWRTDSESCSDNVIDFSFKCSFSSRYNHTSCSQKF